MSFHLRLEILCLRQSESGRNWGQKPFEIRSRGGCRGRRGRSGWTLWTHKAILRSRFSGPATRGHLGSSGPKWQKDSETSSRGSKNWKKGKDPHPQDKIQHLDFTKDPRPLFYKTPPCAFYHKNVCSKAVFGP